MWVLVLSWRFDCCPQKEGWDKMVASAADHDKALAALRADLAAQQKLSKKLTGQVKAKDKRIKDLEAELRSSKAASGANTSGGVNVPLPVATAPSL